MGYVRYKLSEETHEIMRKVSIRLGIKESELSRLAVMEYMKSLGILAERAKRPSIDEIKSNIGDIKSKIKRLGHERIEHGKR